MPPLKEINNRGSSKAYNLYSVEKGEAHCRSISRFLSILGSREAAEAPPWQPLSDNPYNSYPCWGCLSLGIATRAQLLKKSAWLLRPHTGAGRLIRCLSSSSPLSVEVSIQDASRSAPQWAYYHAPPPLTWNKEGRKGSRPTPTCIR